VEQPGDYRRRTVCGRPLFFVKGSDGEVRVFFNTCTHRGATICRRDDGNTNVLQCFYHAWSFNTKGDLIGRPDEAGYSEGFDRAKMGLKSPPRAENYRGFWFVSFNPEVEDLPTYLAGAKEYIDLIVDQSQEGMRVIRGSNKYTMRANWKLLCENSLDGYHAFPTHKTYFDYIVSLWPEMPKGVEGVGRALGNGHTVIEYGAVFGRPIAFWTPLFAEDTKEEIARTRGRLVEQFGEERARRMCETGRNLLIYPNLVINDIMAITIRYFDPVAPDNMQVTAWELAPREESERLLATRLDSFLTFLGPGGFATPDDVEALESCQAGFSASGVEWSDVSRGMHRNAQAADELQMRGFWRRWHAHMMGLGSVGPPTSDR
jgi:p-cumate 2,3-dioxygenase alpha subunit